jgi:deazaflavin-dependent oxidoreductase (nitroreductase family)
MPLPRWLAGFNRKAFNPREVAGGERPVLTHVGRVSGVRYQTPLAAYSIPGGYVFVLMYGARSDWARNVLAASRARLTVDDREIELVNPRLVSRARARELLPESVKLPPGVLRVNDFLEMDLGS